jgi:hypothetical protein
MPKFGDTPQHDLDKCATCANLTEIKGRSFKEHIRRCDVVSREKLPPVVTACTEYRERTRQSLHEMHLIAWVIELDQKKRDVGFRPPRKATMDPDDLMWSEAQKVGE